MNIKFVKPQNMTRELNSTPCKNTFKINYAQNIEFTNILNNLLYFGVKNM